MARFLGAAERRGEIAILISALGDDSPNPEPRSVLSTHDASLLLADSAGSIGSRPLPHGTKPNIAPNLDGADRDLAIRLLNSGRTQWWALDFAGLSIQRYQELEQQDPIGTLEPILVDALGDALVGVWVSEDRRQRWYVVPSGTDWTLIVEWLTERVIREFVPHALRRVRSPELVDDEFLT
ncbi:MAG TPA: hypothetical protein VNG12_24425, partial [Acidimicrobiales bacterium]|nr:hypothetical protein [Acidimicrobiales bacterium]